MKRSEQSINKNTILTILQSVIRVIFPLLTYPYAARILHPEGLGRVSFASSIVAYFVLFTQLGMPVYGLRTCGMLRTDTNRLYDTAADLMLIEFLCGLAVFLCYLVMIISVPLFRADLLLFLIYGLEILFMIVNCDWFYRAMGKYSFLTAMMTVCRMLAAAALFLFVKGNQAVYSYTLIAVFVKVSLSLCSFLWLRQFPGFDPLRRILGKMTLSGIKHAFHRHIASILTFFVMSCTVSVYSHIDTTMLGIIKDSQTVGLYSLAARVRFALAMLSGAVVSVSLPIASGMWNANDMHHFQKLALRSFHIVIGMSLPLSVFFILFAGPCVRVIGGADYLLAAVPLQVLLLAIFPIGISNVFGTQMLIPTGHESILLKAELLGLFSNFLGNAVFIPRYGAAGASAATVLSETVVSIATGICVKRLLAEQYSGLRPLFPVFLKSAAGCVFAGLTAWLLRVHFLNNNTLWQSFLGLAAGGCIFGLIYIAWMVLTKDTLYLDILRTVRRFCTIR